MMRRVGTIGLGINIIVNEPRALARAMHNSSRFYRGAMIILTILLLPQTVPGQTSAISPEKFLQASPDDALMVLYLNPKIEETAAAKALGPVAQLANLAELTGIWGEVKAGRRRAVDVLHSWPVLKQFPQAFVLCDLQISPISQQRNQLDSLSGAILLKTNGNNQAVEQEIQHYLNLYTTDETSRIEKTAIDHFEGYRLIDSRLPKDSSVVWGKSGDLYLVAVGPDLAEQIVQRLNQPASDSVSNNLRRQVWFSDGYRRTKAYESTTMLYVNSDRLRRQLGLGVADQFYSLISSLGLLRHDQMLWSWGQSQEAITWYGYYRMGEQSDLVRIADSADLTPSQKQQIPADSDWHMVVRRPAARVFEQMRSLLLSLFKPQMQIELREGWRVLAEQEHINLERDILSQLGDCIIVHNYPRHPLNWPLMWTVSIEITGDSNKVREALDKVLTYCALRLQVIAQREDAPVFAPALQHDPDSVWYVQFGVYGPALKVTDGWLVVSYSPTALRKNLPPAENPQPQEKKSPEESNTPQDNLDGF